MKSEEMQTIRPLMLALKRESNRSSTARQAQVEFGKSASDILDFYRRVHDGFRVQLY